MRLGLGATAAPAAARTLPAARSPPAAIVQPAGRRPCRPALLAAGSRLGGVAPLCPAGTPSSLSVRRRQQRQPQRPPAPMCQAAAGAAPLPGHGGSGVPPAPPQVPPELKKVGGELHVCWQWRCCSTTAAAAPTCLSLARPCALRCRVPSIAGGEDRQAVAGAGAGVAGAPHRAHGRTVPAGERGSTNAGSVLWAGGGWAGGRVQLRCVRLHCWPSLCSPSTHGDASTHAIQPLLPMHASSQSVPATAFVALYVHSTPPPRGQTSPPLMHSHKFRSLCWPSPLWRCTSTPPTCPRPPRACATGWTSGSAPCLRSSTCTAGW